MSLDRLAVGESGSIVSVAGAPGLRRRLRDMGLVRGATVQVSGVAPLGDPIAIAVMGYRLSIRRSDARHIIVLMADGDAQ